MDLHKEFWNKKYTEPDEFAKINHTSESVQYAADYFPQGGHVLELGAGIGHDTRYLRRQGFVVTTTDFSDASLNHLRTTFHGEASLAIAQLDLTKRFPFSDDIFDAILANLVLYYFDRKTTYQIYEEIHRVLKPGGTLTAMVNTKTDPEYGQGQTLEEDFFELQPGRPKRYFNIDTLRVFTKKFKTIILDDQGIDSRRSEKANLIRFIGRK